VRPGSVFENEMSLKHCRKETIKTARELTYNFEVIERIKNAESVNEITRIMLMARKGEI